MNILLVVSDQERQWDWLPDGVELPARRALADSGLSFNRYYTHSSPCSPSRATLMTGQYVPQHGVNENVIHPIHRELDPAIPTLGHLLRERGYTTAYLGKWHLSQAAQPDMEAYGYGDWHGNDKAFMGWAGTGFEYDGPITDQAVGWLAAHAADTKPWFLTVALVNPHDVMWFPIDQQWYQDKHPDECRMVRELLGSVEWKEGEVLPPFPDTFDEWFDELPANFGDDLGTKPEVHRTWMEEQQSALYGYIDPADKGSWLRHLDYYVKLHQLGDVNLGRILDALDATGRADDTVVVFTSDHGDMCGSHGLRSKGPFNYEEILNIPLVVRAPGVTSPATTTDALASHVDIATTIAAIGGVNLNDAPTLKGGDLSAVLADPSSPGRGEVLFAQDSAWYERCIKTRYASRGLFDGRYKYCRYYGVGGSTTPWGTEWPEPKRYDVDAAFDDHEHELYDLQEDPHELVNLARDLARRAEVRRWFDRLLELERTSF